MGTGFKKSGFDGVKVLRGSEKGFGVAKVRCGKRVGVGF